MAEYLSREQLEYYLEACKLGPGARAHHELNGIFDLARLFLAGHDQTLRDEWLKDAVADALATERKKVEHKFRNYKRALSRSRSRERQRNLSAGGALEPRELTACGPNAADSLAVSEPQAAQFNAEFPHYVLWDAIRDVARSG